MCARSIDDDIIDKTEHIGYVASSRTINKVGHFVGWRDTLVVIECQIEVPDRTRIKLTVVTFLIHIDTPISIGVARQLANKEMAQETVQVEIRAPLLLHRIEVVLDILRLLRGNLVIVGRFDSDGIAFV